MMIRRMAYAYGRRNRRRKIELVRGALRATRADSLLLVGVDPREEGVNNLAERGLLDTVPRVVATGLGADDGSWPSYVRADALDLPFDDDEFDLVFSNAVIEHVGGEQRQRRMLSEIARVGRSWIVTTPNRWFPIEAHHHSAFWHWRRSWAPHGSVTRLLGIRDLEAMLPDGRVLGLPLLSPTLTAVHIDRERIPRDGDDDADAS